MNTFRSNFCNSSAPAKNSKSDCVLRLMFAVLLLAAASGDASAQLSRLQNQLDMTPEGGWVKVSTGLFSSAFPTGAAAVDVPSYQNPSTIVTAWSSFAWDSARGDLILFGGGHANYAGNEVYVWDGATGVWSRGSLPSRLDANNFVVDNATPQSSHTYDNSVYLTVNDRFLSFGGAAYQSGGNWATNVGGVPSRAGPWVWDPSKADANKVGGTSGSGYAPGSVGGNMWQNRQGQWTGVQGPSFVDGTTAYRVEGGRDVVYVTADSEASGHPALYRYEVGNLSTPGALDSWQTVGFASANTVSWQGAATMDSAHGFYIKTASNAAGADFALWNVDAALANGIWATDMAISLQMADGTPFEVTRDFGIDYDSQTGHLLLWDGKSSGGVWSTQAEFDAAGAIKSVWTVTQLTSTTVDQPAGNFVRGVLGKWKYVDALGAFVALDEFNPSTSDAEVWMYKPFGIAGAVPEPNSAVLALCGGMVVLVWMRKKRSLAGSELPLRAG